MKVSVVIPALNERTRIGDTLTGVLRQDHTPDEIIVVDNGKDGTGDDVKAHFPGVQVYVETRVGTQHARDCGRRAATGDVIAFLDADTIPTCSWLRSGVRRLWEDPRAIALTGPYLFHDGLLRHQVFAYLQSKYFYEATKKFVECGGGSLMSGANMFIKRRAFGETIVFDTSIGFEGDDVDTAMRLSEIGKILWAADALVYTSARRFDRDGMVWTIVHDTLVARRVIQKHRQKVLVPVNA